jgi:hypothetical protein
MSDIEEVVLTRNTKTSSVKKDTKPEIARQKLKEKRERLKKEKEDAMINEAKRRLAEDLESKKLEESKKKKEEEDKLKNDPIYQIRMMLEKLATPPPPPAVKGKLKRQTAQPSEPVYVEPRVDSDSEAEVDAEIEVKPKSKRVYKKKVIEPKEPKEVVQPPPKASKPPPKPRAPRKKKVAIEESPTTQFYGTAPETEPQQVYYIPGNPLLDRMAQRRRMGSYY